MIAVIDGKRYNTDTAKGIHYWSNMGDSRDFRWRSKELYRTQGGAYFIHHSGGPMTDMAESHGNNVSGGERIEPVSARDAMRFLASHDGAGKIAKHSDLAEQVEDA